MEDFSAFSQLSDSKMMDALLHLGKMELVTHRQSVQIGVVNPMVLALVVSEFVAILNSTAEGQHRKTLRTLPIHRQSRGFAI